MKNVLIALSLLALPAAAQTEWLNTSLEFRADYTYNSVGGQEVNKGFKGQYLNLKLNGIIDKHFSYAYRQRFSKDMVKSGGFLNATDYLYLNYRPIKNLNIQAGKQFVWIGGYEYDKAPIDVYQYTEYCQFIECYGYGVSVDYNVSANDNLLVQAAQSAFAGHDRDYYSYNIKWTGKHSFFSSIYSLGFHEYDRGKYLSCLALGNRFDFGCGHVLLDYVNRYDVTNGGKLWADFTAMSEVHVQPIKELNIFAHYCHTHNEDNYGDPTVRPGTSLNTIGGGVEFFPIKGDPDVRVHAAYFRNFGTNGNPSGVLLDNQNYLTVGLTFRVNVKKIMERVKAKKETN